MNFKLDLLHIGGFINENLSLIIIIGVLAVISAVGCVAITMLRKGLIEDVIFAGAFGLVFNVLGLLFVIFRKPVWNNLGWIPVVVAWFFIDPSANTTFAILLIIYAIAWMITQHLLLERIQVVEE